MFDDLVANFVGIIEGARDTLLSVTSLDDRAVKRGFDAFLEWSKQPDASMWYGTFWAEGVKRKTESSRAKPPVKKRGGSRISTMTEAPSRSLDKLETLRFLADSARDLNSSLKLDDVYKEKHPACPYASLRFAAGREE